MSILTFELIEEKLKERDNIILEITELMFIRNLSEQYSKREIYLEYGKDYREIDEDIFITGESVAEDKSHCSLSDRLVNSCSNKIDNRLEKLELIGNELTILRESK